MPYTAPEQRVDIGVRIGQSFRNGTAENHCFPWHDIFHRRTPNLVPLKSN